MKSLIIVGRTIFLLFATVLFAACCNSRNAECTFDILAFTNEETSYSVKLFDNASADTVFSMNCNGDMKLFFRVPRKKFDYDVIVTRMNGQDTIWAFNDAEPYTRNILGLDEYSVIHLYQFRQDGIEMDYPSFFAKEYPVILYPNQDKISFHVERCSELP